MNRQSGGRGATWLSRQLAGARTGLIEEDMYAEGAQGRDLRDLQSAHPLHHIVPDHARIISKASWQVRMGHVLESHQAHMVVMALVVFDLIAVFGEVMLTNVCGIEREKAEERLANESDSEALSALHREERIHAWESGLHRFSIAVVVALLVYVLGLALSFGAKFFTKVWYVLDAIVLIITLALEFSLTNDSSGFLPLILSWRVVRIAHGFLVTEESPTSEVAKLRKRIDASRALVSWDAEEDVPALRRRLGEISAIIEAVDDEAFDEKVALGTAAADPSATQLIITSEATPSLAAGSSDRMTTSDVGSSQAASPAAAAAVTAAGPFH
jgi:hypothetical protein